MQEYLLSRENETGLCLSALSKDARACCPSSSFSVHREALCPRICTGANLLRSKIMRRFKAAIAGPRNRTAVGAVHITKRGKELVLLRRIFVGKKSFLNTVFSHFFDVITRGSGTAKLTQQS